MELKESKKGAIVSFVLLIGFSVVFLLVKDSDSQLVFIESLIPISILGVFVFFFTLVFYGANYIFDTIFLNNKKDNIEEINNEKD